MSNESGVHTDWQNSKKSFLAVHSANARALRPSFMAERVDHRAMQAIAKPAIPASLAITPVRLASCVWAEMYVSTARVKNVLLSSARSVGLDENKLFQDSVRQEDSGLSVLGKMDKSPLLTGGEES